MHRRCIALILGMAILLCSIPVRIERDGLAEEGLAQMNPETAETYASMETPAVETIATAEPTAEPTVEPISESAVEPASEPTAEPDVESTVEPASEPTVEPTTEPTSEPTVEPTTEPTLEPTVEPTIEATSEPTVEPTTEPTSEPTVEPTIAVTTEPIAEPTASLTPETATPAPTSVPVFYCGFDEHVHVDICYSASNELVCDIPEHVHNRECLIKTTQEPTSTPIPEMPEIDGESPLQEATILPKVTPAESETTPASMVPAATDETSENTIQTSPAPPSGPSSTACGLVDHFHGDLCYADGLLTCDLLEHAHAKACFAVPESPSTPEPFGGTKTLCSLEEHLHSESCYTEEQELNCSLEEHNHTEACYSEPENTPIISSTPSPSEIPSVSYYCGKDVHIHSDFCYELSGEMTCHQEEHEHIEACAYPLCTATLMTSADKLILGKDVLTVWVDVAGGKAPYSISISIFENDDLLSEEIHVLEGEGTLEVSYQPPVSGSLHLKAVITDSNGADISAECIVSVTEPVPEIKEDWTESFAHIQLAENLRENVLAIAQTQLGYAESETDFIFADGMQKGYTRYGAWFDSPYEDWCAMFAAFCLHYANIEDDFPLSGNVPEWIEALKESGNYHAASKYLPAVGDLIFFDWDADGLGDHVGLVAEANASSDEILLTLKTIEGNVDNQVAYREYELPADERILGFGQIDVNETMMMIDAVEALIDPIPPVEEVEKIMMAMSGTDEETVYLMQLVELCLTAWNEYEPLGATLQNYVSNAGLLWDLEWLWSMHLLADTPGGTSETPVARTDDLQTVGSSSGIKFRLFNYDANINSNGHKDVFGFRGANLHDPEGDDTVINASLDADGYGANRAKVKPLLSNGYPAFDGRGITSDFSLGYLFGAGGNGVTSYSPSNTPLLRNSSTNLYRYDSARNAVDFDIANNRFIVRNYVERGDSTAAFGSGYADFMPFTYWNNTTSHVNSSGVEYFYDSDLELDYWFGMTMDTTFFQPKGGHIAQDEMVFSFSGDDDVWVFIDDVLVLDLGGTHGVVTGSINFATGEIVQHLDWAGASTPSYPTTLRECFAKAGREPAGGWNADGSTFADYSKHTFKFFYLERGAGSSNCKLTFNLPTLPDESLTVTKELTSDALDEETGSFIENSLQYTFRVMKSDAEGNATNELFIQPGTSYTLLQNGAAIGTGSVQDDGTFLLKAGQSAQFNEMIAKGNGALRYVVQEILPDDLTGQYGGIEYEVSGAGGEIKTEEGPTESFTAFQTDVLSAEESQIVTYRNKVAINSLSILKLSKEQAEGSVFPTDQVFQLHVRLGDELLPAGTSYVIDGTDEVHTVSADGIVELKIGETATIQKGILSGTEYRITEIGTDEGGFNVTFSGTVTQNDAVSPLPTTADNAEGSFPLNSTVHVVAENASYDFSLVLPLTKQAVNNQESTSFSFLIEQGKWSDGVWTHLSDLPGTTITVIDDAATHGRIIIGYSSDASGTFYYKISELQGGDSFIYDDTYYIVEATVGDRQAAVTSIWRNGTEALDLVNALTFVNLKTVPVTIDKTVTGTEIISTDETFVFTLRVDEGGPFVFPENDAYVKTDDTSIRFTLSHEQSITIPHVPVGATITISETGNEGYVTLHRVGSQADASIGSVVTLNGVTEHTTVSFINRSGYMLPATGGGGAYWYTTGGFCLMTLALLLYITKRSWKGGC